jgi:hypothetical protein
MVEFDDTYIGGKKKLGKRGRGKSPRAGCHGVPCQGLWDGTLLLKQLSKKFNKAKQLC